jgi:transcriptional regulator with XRE-family HTH domain
MFKNQVYRQKNLYSVVLGVKSIKDLNKLIGSNLKRIRLKKGLTQEKLGEMINVDGNVIARIEGGIIGLGKRNMIKLCNALGIEPAEFFIDNTTPLPSSELEQKALYMAREAEKLGVEYIVEEAVEYTMHRLTVVKKQKGKDIGKSKTTRIKTGNEG